MGSEELASRHGFPDEPDCRAAGARGREPNAVVGEHRMNRVGDCLDEATKEAGRDGRRGLFV